MTGSLRRAVVRLQWELLAIFVFAFLLRLGYRLAHGEAAFLNNGYTFYRDLADSFLRGHGLCFDGGVGCAVRVPVYPVRIVFPEVGLSLSGLADRAGRHQRVALSHCLRNWPHSL